MFAESKSLHILEHEILRFDFAHDTDVVTDQRIARIVERALTDQREPLTGRAAEHDIDFALADPGGLADRCAGDFLYVAANRGAVGEIELVGRTMDGVYLDGGDNVEPRLFETQA